MLVLVLILTKYIWSDLFILIQISCLVVSCKYCSRQTAVIHKNKYIIPTQYTVTHIQVRPYYISFRILKLISLTSFISNHKSTKCSGFYGNGILHRVPHALTDAIHLTELQPTLCSSMYKYSECFLFVILWCNMFDASAFFVTYVLRHIL